MQTDVGLRRIASDLRVALRAARATTAGLSDEAVLELMADFELIGRLASAGQVHTAGEVGVRSRAELGDEGLSRSQNFTSPVKLVAHVTGASARECKSRLELGRKLQLPPWLEPSREQIARALPPIVVPPVAGA